MSDDPRVTVPAELVDKLREALAKWDAPLPKGVAGIWSLGYDAIAAAPALVDAAERPAAPVSEPLCRCGHRHPFDPSGTYASQGPPCEGYWTRCRCTKYTPTPPRVPVSDEAPEDEPISADHLRKAVLQWASRFIPGDRWDTEDVRDLETALGGTVENRCHHRSFDAPISDEAEAGLSEDEHEAMRLTVQLVEVVCQRIIGDGESRSGDVNEFVADIHRIQNRIMAQAAGRAHPALYRLLGAGFRAARQAGKDEQP